MTVTVIQPDAAAGKDTRLYSVIPTTNYGTGTAVSVGDSSTGYSAAWRSLISLDLSGIPAGDIIDAFVLSLWDYDSGRTAGAPASWGVNLRKLSRAWTESGATWNTYDGTNNWGTAGAGADGTDRVSTISAALTMDGTPAGAFVDFSGAQLTADVQAVIGSTCSWLLSAETAEYQGDAGYAYNAFYSSDYTTDANKRPKATIIHHTPSSGAAGFYHTFMQQTD